MNPSICNICGANYENRNGRWKCPACGAYKPEELSNEELTLMFVADQKRRIGDFEEAERAYTDIIEKYPQNCYGYWGRLLSKHGIKYERDYDGRMIPTCCAPTIESLYSDKDCLSAIDLADSDTKQYFTSQAEYIESVRDLWVKKASKEKPYDIFICYKDSDLANNIHRTADSIDAQNLYTHLVEKGYRVFFSRESLRDKIGEKYEPYIFGALSTAKVMIVYGKSSEYITSTWLKNEWSRYLKLMREGAKKSNSLIVAYEGFSPSELPTALSSAQCLDASGWNFYLDLDKAIKSILEVKKQETKKEEPQKEPFAKKSKTKAIACPACGGNFSSTDLLDGDKIVTCLDCGKSFLTSEILKENGNPFKHTPKPKPPKRELTYEEIRMAEERAAKFKKRKLSKFIIFSMVIFLLISISMFANGNFLIGVMAAASAILLLVSYLFGIQVIKVGNYNMHVLPAIAAFLMIAPMCIFGGSTVELGNPEDAIHTYEIRNYVGRNAATICKEESGYQVDEYGSGKLRIVFVTESGMFLLPANSELKQQYVVIAQNIPEKTSINIVHQTDSWGKPYSNLVDYQSYEEIILYVAPIGDTSFDPTVVEPQPVLDRHKFYVRDYVGKNAATFGAYSNNERIDKYGAGQLKITFSTDDGSFVNSSDINELKKYVVVSQNIAANTELQLEYEKNSSGKEYDNLIANQNYEQIELTVTKLSEEIISTMPEISASNSGSSSSEKTELTVKYRVLTSKTAEISGFVGDGNHATINSKIDGYEIVGIGDSAFQDCTTLESVLFWADIKTIGDYAFAGCTSLKEISIPNETTSIGNHAFENCSNLVDLIIWGNPNIGDYAFAGCTSLVDVSLSYGTEKVGDYAFSGCTNLESVIVWDDNTRFGVNAFYNCPKLKDRPIRDE